ncbi:MAG: lipoate--protein ligase [Clostridia bacterium]|nr:lipoate--protein ligase [Clostridia bacterium]
MFKKLLIVKAESENVYVNQGIEKALFDSIEDDTYLLYIWTNENTVVIGKNQDAYSEVDVDLLYKEGGCVARRLTGGGAVFHDRGNVNFTFIAKRPDFSLEINRRIILNALKSIGIDAYLTGRNDIEVDGCKISGNAYLKEKDKEMHHGTMLITSLADKVARYLTPAKTKFAGKSVKSVKSRVASLNSFKNVTKEEFVEALISSFENEFGLKAEIISSKKVMGGSAAFFRDEKWIFGRKKEYAYKAHFEEDNIRYDIVFNLDGDTVKECEVYTDSLGTEDAEKLYRRIYKEKLSYENELMRVLSEAVNV